MGLVQTPVSLPQAKCEKSTPWRTKGKQTKTSFLADSLNFNFTCSLPRGLSPFPEPKHIYIEANLSLVQW